MNLTSTLSRYAGPIPCWAPIGLPEEQQLVDVMLDSWDGSIDVTSNHVVASLAPLIVAVGRADVFHGRLIFVDRATGLELARLSLQRMECAGGGNDFSLLRVNGGRHRCLPAGLRTWHRLLQARWRHPPGFRMSNSAVHHLTLFYICPRPVVLVSVDDGTNNNLFPMDLIGRLRDRHMLALRNTSPSVATMRASRHVALADVELGLVKTVYELGKHHKLARIEWDQLPFESVRTPEFGLRVPARAQRIREFSIERWWEVGSHTLFECLLRSDRTVGSLPRLHHTSGIHRAFRQYRGALPWHENGGA
jgi:flavin reductase (DIM6/NTAB) family NADH-FMN oxidoreductase RutF